MIDGFPNFLKVAHWNYSTSVITLLVTLKSVKLLTHHNDFWNWICVLDSGQWTLGLREWTWSLCLSGLAAFSEIHCTALL